MKEEDTMKENSEQLECEIVGGPTVAEQMGVDKVDWYLAPCPVLFNDEPGEPEARDEEIKVFTRGLLGSR